MNTPKDAFLTRVNIIAETEYFITPTIIRALKGVVLTDEGRAMVGPFNNHYEFWEARKGHYFFKMGTFIRLGSEIENGLKYYYMNKMGHNTLIDLANDADYEMNIFQRLMPWTTGKTATAIFNQNLQYDLNTNPFFPKVQELMLLRHLYAHNVGILTKKFIDQYKQITQIDLEANPDYSPSYTVQDTCFFEPLEKIGEFVEASRKFIHQLPQ